MGIESEINKCEPWVAVSYIKDAYIVLSPGDVREGIGIVEKTSRPCEFVVGMTVRFKGVPCGHSTSKDGPTLFLEKDIVRL